MYKRKGSRESSANILYTETQGSSGYDLLPVIKSYVGDVNKDANSELVPTIWKLKGLVDTESFKSPAELEAVIQSVFLVLLDFKEHRSTILIGDPSRCSKLLIRSLAYFYSAIAEKTKAIMLLIKLHSSGNTLKPLIEVLGELLEDNIDCEIKEIIVDFIGRVKIICDQKKIDIAVGSGESWFQPFLPQHVHESLQDPKTAMLLIEQSNPHLSGVVELQRDCLVGEYLDQQPLVCLLNRFIATENFLYFAGGNDEEMVFKLHYSDMCQINVDISSKMSTCEIQINSSEGAYWISFTCACDLRFLLDILKRKVSGSVRINEINRNSEVIAEVSNKTLALTGLLAEEGGNGISGSKVKHASPKHIAEEINMNANHNGDDNRGQNDNSSSGSNMRSSVQPATRSSRRSKSDLNNEDAVEAAKFPINVKNVQGVASVLSGNGDEAKKAKNGDKASAVGKGAEEAKSKDTVEVTKDARMQKSKTPVKIAMPISAGSISKMPKLDIVSIKSKAKISPKSVVHSNSNSSSKSNSNSNGDSSSHNGFIQELKGDNLGVDEYIEQSDDRDADYDNDNLEYDSQLETPKGSYYANSNTSFVSTDGNYTPNLTDYHSRGSFHHDSTPKKFSISNNDDSGDEADTLKLLLVELMEINKTRAHKKIARKIAQTTQNATITLDNYLDEWYNYASEQIQSDFKGPVGNMQELEKNSNSFAAGLDEWQSKATSDNNLLEAEINEVISGRQSIEDMLRSMAKEIEADKKVLITHLNKRKQSEISQCKASINGFNHGKSSNDNISTPDMGGKSYRSKESSHSKRSGKSIGNPTNVYAKSALDPFKSAQSNESVSEMGSAQKRLRSK